MINYYTVLEVTQKASKEQIKEAYRLLTSAAAYLVKMLKVIKNYCCAFANYFFEYFFNCEVSTGKEEVFVAKNIYLLAK
jgi:hypothetical protein